MDLIVVLVAAGGLLILIDFFIPTFGLMSLAGVALIIWAHVLAFRMGAVNGMLCLVGTAAYLALVAVVGYKCAKRSPMIHRTKIHPDRAPDELRAKLLGSEGVTMTPLRPSGKVQLDKIAYDAKCDVRFVEAGRPVRVVGVRGSQLAVKPLDGGPA